MPPTDPGLDERVCRKLGWALETRVAWDGVRDWPPVSSSWEWAGKTLDELIAKGWSVSLTYVDDGNPQWWCVLVLRDGPLPLVGKADAATAAVAEAIAAMEGR